MGHSLYRATLSLHTAFGTPLSGLTLFGQLCWAARERLGEDGLHKLLEGYTAGRPWIVVSDGFPSGYLPKPTVPQSFEPLKDPAERKAAKARRWVPVDSIGQPIAELLAKAVPDDVAFSGNKPVEAVQPHNTLNRLTGTTGTGEFAPYTQQQTFFAHGQKMQIFLVLDDSRMQAGGLQALLEDVGLQGFGRDASIGLGKFKVEAFEPFRFPTAADADSFLTLAPIAPQGLGFSSEKSYWRVVTHFGRHGGSHALSTNPFKSPVLLAATGALFSGEIAFDSLFTGQGLGGNGKISKVEPGSVQQGYAPVVPVCSGS